MKRLSDSQAARSAVLVLVIFATLTILFALTPWSGDDWKFFHDSSRLLLSGESLYRAPIAGSYYHYPPWVALALVPLAILTEQIGWAMICALTLVAALLVLRHWSPDNAPGLIKPVLVLSSPAMFYILMHGQIDALIIAGVLLPVEWWWFVAVTKPQVAVGLALGVPPRQWVRAGVIVLAAFGVSVLVAGWWPSELLHHPMPSRNAALNFWLGLWPFQVPAGVALAVKGFQRKDDRLLIASSPFLSPYAATSSLIGPWIAVVTFLTSWQAAIVWASWWGAVLYRQFA
jgi:hypothetical protein